MRTILKRSLLAGLSVGVFALAGCFGGGDDDTPPTAGTVPDSAVASVGDFIAFIRGLATDDETSEPLTLAPTLAPPADDATEPTPLT